MHIDRRVIATLQVILLLPAILFMAALLARSIEPAQTARLIVSWYSDRLWTLWVLLVSLPMLALGLGAVTLLFGWIAPTRQPTPSASPRSKSSPILIVIATAVSLIILVIVAVHVLMN